MNYYYPYFNAMPYMNAAMPMASTASKVAGAATKGGGLRGLLGGIKWGSIVNGTQKTLGIVNQAIPLVKQVRPVFNNAKTMFRVMNEFKKVDTSSTGVATETKTETSVNESSETTKSVISDSGPTFFQ